MVADVSGCGLKALGPAHIQTDGSVEFKRAAAGRDLRLAEHNPDLLTELVD